LFDAADSWWTAMSERRACPQFQTRIESYPLRTISAMLPVRRCLLAERMVQLVRGVEAADPVVRTVVFNRNTDPPYCLYGPDLESIEHWKCTADRCAGSCSPSYREILARFGVSDPEEIACSVVVGEHDSASSPG
jgi:hypothetical protein